MVNSKTIILSLCLIFLISCNNYNGTWKLIEETNTEKYYINNDTVIYLSQDNILIDEDNYLIVNNDSMIYFFERYDENFHLYNSRKSSVFIRSKYEFDKSNYIIKKDTLIYTSSDSLYFHVKGNRKKIFKKPVTSKYIKSKYNINEAKLKTDPLFINFYEKFYENLKYSGISYEVNEDGTLRLEEDLYCKDKNISKLKNDVKFYLDKTIGDLPKEEKSTYSRYKESYIDYYLYENLDIKLRVELYITSDYFSEDDKLVVLMWLNRK